MKNKLVGFLAMALLCGPIAANAAEIFASTTFTLLRGTFPGNFPGQFYGGSLIGGFPVVLTNAQARASVLGAPDDQFLSLPGGPGVTGTAFQGAYIEVGFGTNFGPNTTLNIWETGYSGESAQLFLWTNVGGNIQPVVTTNASGEISLDLSVYAPILAAMGATSFTKVGIGGLDQLGASAGFDLDAVSIKVPEPATIALTGLGLLVFGMLYRRRIVRARI
ncbi:MAG TPA: PEP-CTERM sorting domain-containing protein [Steroidobacteraceae bacterium]|nr:PEP-CTERM sorting domain-containing protein [Steroidobacteraceae bacterium]